MKLGTLSNHVLTKEVFNRVKLIGQPLAVSSHNSSGIFLYHKTVISNKSHVGIYVFFVWNLNISKQNSQDQKTYCFLLPYISSKNPNAQCPFLLCSLFCYFGCLKDEYVIVFKSHYFCYKSFDKEIGLTKLFSNLVQWASVRELLTILWSWIYEDPHSHK